MVAPIATVGDSSGLPAAAAHIQHELSTNRNTCLQLLWEEYREAHPDQAYS
jgi:hypothetical protein